MLLEIRKDLNVSQWSKAFGKFSMQKIGIQGAPLACVLCADAEPKGEHPGLAVHKPHTKKHCLVLVHVAQFYTHDHLLCQEDSSMLFKTLDEALQNAPHCSSLKP